MKNSRETKAYNNTSNGSKSKPVLSVSLITALILSFALCGCETKFDFDDSDSSGDVPAISFTESTVADTGSENAIEVFDTDGEILTTNISVIEEAEREDNDSLMAADKLPGIVDEISDDDSSKYAYGQLSPSARNTYKEILSILKGFYEDVVLSVIDCDEIELAFKAVMIDHPEIFYVDGYTLGKYMVDGKLTKVTFSGSYTMTEEEAEAKKHLVDDYVENVILNSPVSDEYEKIKYVYEYLVENNEYDLLAQNDQNVLSVVEGGRTVCQGYTKMFQLIMDRMGIFCTLVNGRATTGGSDVWEPHVWNIVRCNGQYYNVDVTWGDSVFDLINNSGGDSLTVDVNYEFLLAPDTELTGSHEAVPAVEIPSCTAMTDYYYVREGLYFDCVDEAKLKSAFDSEFEKGSKMIFIKTSDSNVFDDMCRHLFDEQHVFDYTGQNNARYVNLDTRKMIMISL